MTEQEMGIAIAEECGAEWWEADGMGLTHLLPKGMSWSNYHRGKRPPPPVVFSVDHCPDYLHDLNAMHAAEKVLQVRCKYWPDYIDELAKLFPFTQGGTNWSQMCHATAAQRAEAFLRTFGKWKD